MMKFSRAGIRDLALEIKTIREAVIATSNEVPPNSVALQHILFLSVCALTKNDACLHKLTHDYKDGGLIGYGHSINTNKLLSRFKLLRLHAAFHDAFGYMKTHYNVGPGYSYVCSSALPSSCFVGHISGVLYWLYVKIFHSSSYDNIVV